MVGPPCPADESLSSWDLLVSNPHRFNLYLLKMQLSGEQQ